VHAFFDYVAGRLPDVLDVCQRVWATTAPSPVSPSGAMTTRSWPGWLPCDVMFRQLRPRRPVMCDDEGPLTRPLNCPFRRSSRARTTASRRASSA
jgi:hypothetical protein